MAAAAEDQCTEENYHWVAGVHHHHQHHHHLLPNHNSNSSCEDQDHVSISATSSFTNASNHSGLTVEYSSNDLLTHHASDHNNHLWSHLLLNIGSNEQDIGMGENFLEAISSKNSNNNNNNNGGGIFEQSTADACSDYLRKMDDDNNGNSWENFPINFTTSNFVNDNGGVSELNEETLLKLSNHLVTTSWSIALPNSSPIDDDGPPRQNHISTNSDNRFPMIFTHDLKPDITFTAAADAAGGGVLLHHQPESDAHQLIEEQSAPCLFQRSFNGYYHNQIISGVNGGAGKQYYGYNNNNVDDSSSPCTTTSLSSSRRNFADYISFNNRLNVNINNSCCKSRLNHSSSADHSKKQILHSSPARTTTTTTTRINGRSGNGSVVTSEGKKKRSEESSETASIKKPKQDNSSTTKMQLPKVKNGDRITALQQIVSPFGKTDTASVLTETIGYIKFLQEQVQLLSNPYMKTNTYKDPWQSSIFDRKEEGKIGEIGKIDLKSRGLCLVPISSTPQVYRDSTGSDYWTPYRGCFYR